MMWAVRVCVWIVLIFQARIGCLLCCCLTSLTALAGWTQWWPLCQNLYNYPPPTSESFAQTSERFVLTSERFVLTSERFVLTSQRFVPTSQRFGVCQTHAFLQQIWGPPTWHKPLRGLRIPLRGLSVPLRGLSVPLRGCVPASERFAPISERSGPDLWEVSVGGALGCGLGGCFGWWFLQTWLV